MKKGIWLTIVAVILVGIIIAAMWYIDRRGKLANNSKDSFIPYNSAVVVNINSGTVLPEKLKKTFASDISRFRTRLLFSVADTLAMKGFAASTSRIVAARAEGKEKVVFLFVMDNQEVFSSRQVVDFIRETFPGFQERIRKFDKYKIYRIGNEKEEIYYSVEEGMILISDSELYVEDALKQFDRETKEDGEKIKYKNIDKYFSPAAGMNVFLNTGCFKELLPMFIDSGALFENLDVTEFFKWGALDGDLGEDELILNGFMDYNSLPASYMKVLTGQRAKESTLESIIPVRPESFFLLNLSDLKSYFGALDNYRYNAGFIEKVRKRKQTCQKLWGAEAETELRELLQGEFALVNLSFNESQNRQEGLVIAGLKSGGLCRSWLEKTLGNYARSTNVHPESFRKIYRTDKDRAYTYYKFPVNDMAALFWGYLFGGVENNFALIEDNYLILASSEKAMADFLKDYVHHTSVKDTEWYKYIKERLSAKYNLAYFAETALALPSYKRFAKGDLKKCLSEEEKLASFSTLALQWSEEGGLLYNTIVVGMKELDRNPRPHLLWQTKLEAPVSMKPMSVINHVSGERELLVQDDQNRLYLLNEAGRILWYLPLEGKINSEVYQVDAYKNGKLQYLFSTSAALYLIDRNGRPVEPFPVKFKSACERGITLFDYDKTRNYRIFAPGADREVYLYDIQGKLVKGWDRPKADKEIMTAVEHFRVEGKDYIVFADPYRLYILDRKGKERVKVSTVFDLRANTKLYLAQDNGKAVLVFADKTGDFLVTDFTGKVRKSSCGKKTAAFAFNVADVNNDGKEECIYTDGGIIQVYDLKGNVLFEKKTEASSLDFPYVYRFSGMDTRIGLLDKDRNQMWLLSIKEGFSKGFPIEGTSPFSIVFAGSGDFYLFAGAANNTLMKYKVQR